MCVSGRRNLLGGVQDEFRGGRVVGKQVVFVQVLSVSSRDDGGGVQGGDTFGAEEEDLEIVNVFGRGFPVVLVEEREE